MKKNDFQLPQICIKNSSKYIDNYELNYLIKYQLIIIIYLK